MPFSAARAQASLQKPYRDVPRQADDAKRVLIFFDFACPVCAAMHDRLARWGASLPRDWMISFVPVSLQNKESVAAARAFYAVAMYEPERLLPFMAAGFKAAGGSPARLALPATWQAAAKEARVRDLASAWSKVDREIVLQANRKLVAYSIDATPSVAIDGRFVITPDNTSGSADMFFQLANGMVSKAISDAA